MRGFTDRSYQMESLPATIISTRAVPGPEQQLIRKAASLFRRNVISQ
jgi:hypothetical protein